MLENNPYATPQARVNDVQEEGFGEIKLFTAKGRIGRLRYFVYSMAMGVASMLLIGLLSSLFLVNDVLGTIGVVVGYIAMFVVGILLTIQRAHDFNTTGWLSLLYFVPFAILIFYFIPGTKGSNQYGLQPPENSKGIVLSAFLIPLLLLLLLLLGVGFSVLSAQLTR